jgi:hypothetical protein
MIDGQFDNLVAASSQQYDPATAPNGVGGHLDNRVLDATGLEPEQLVEKGYYCAGLMDEAKRIASSELNSAADVDRLGALFGAWTNFANSDNAAEGADRFSAKYIARRTPSAGGLYLDAKDALITMRATFEQEVDFSTELAAAKTKFFESWEKGMAASAINYIYAAVDDMSATGAGDEEIASGLHAVSEGIGFVWGVYVARSDYRIATNDQLKSALAAMYFNADTFESTLYMSHQSASGTTALLNAVTELADIYGFTSADLESFKLNYVSEEGRQ